MGGFLLLEELVRVEEIQTAGRSKSDEQRQRLSIGECVVLKTCRNSNLNILNLTISPQTISKRYILS